MSITVIMAVRCNPVSVPLKGSYREKAIAIASAVSADSAWSSLAAIFASNGLTVKNIDKKNGIITTIKAPVSSIYTFEDTDGHLEHPQAWIVLKKTFNRKKEWRPNDIYGQWRIQITEKTAEEITTVQIEPVVICIYFPNTFTKVETRGQSTGKLEELLARSIGKKTRVN